MHLKPASPEGQGAFHLLLLRCFPLMWFTYLFLYLLEGIISNISCQKMGVQANTVIFGVALYGCVLAMVSVTGTVDWLLSNLNVKRARCIMHLVRAKPHVENSMLRPPCSYPLHWPLVVLCHRFWRPTYFIFFWKIALTERWTLLLAWSSTHAQRCRSQ